MGKKSSRRSRTKEVKIKDPCREEAQYKSRILSSINWLCKTLCKDLQIFYGEYDESVGTGRTLIRLLKFWIEGGRFACRFDMSSSLMDFIAKCDNSTPGYLTDRNHSGTKFKYLLGCFRTLVMKFMDEGLIERAKVLIRSFYLIKWMMRLAADESFDVHASLASMSREITCHEKEWVKLRSSPATPLKRVEKEGLNPDIIFAFFYAESRTRMTNWLLTMDAFSQQSLHYYTFGTLRVPIRLTGKCSCCEERKQRVIYINPTIRLETLVMLSESIFEGSIADHKIVLQDQFGTSKGVLLMQYSGKKSLCHIGIEANDTLHFFDAKADDCPKLTQSNQRKVTTKLASKKTKTKKNKQIADTTSSQSSNVSSPKPKPNSTRKQSTHDRVDYSSNKDQYRFNHSKLLTLVFEEADIQFQERRQILNNLAIKKCEPKKKASKTKQKASEAASVDYCCTPDTRVKAGKTVFPVLVGHEEYLYKSSKSSRGSQNRPLSIDLHGCTRDEAINKLNNSLQVWIDDAMKDYPYTVRVDIITGAGYQVLSETVEQWIRENRTVANRFA